MIKDNVNQQYVYKVCKTFKFVITYQFMNNIIIIFFQAEPIKSLDPPTELSPIFRDDSNGFPQ